MNRRPTMARSSLLVELRSLPKTSPWLFTITAGVAVAAIWTALHVVFESIQPWLSAAQNYPAVVAAEGEFSVLVL